MNRDYFGYFLAIISILYAYYLQRKSTRIKEPVYSIINYKIMDDYKSAIPNLKVSYSNKKVKSFSTARILFYNRGSETITRQDLDTINHLRITVNEGVKILDALVIQSNNSSNLFSVELRDNQAIIHFDYLDKNHGVVITVMHTGLSSDDIKIVGDIKGVNRLVNLSRISKIDSKLVEFLTRRKVLRTGAYALLVMIIITIGLASTISIAPDIILDASTFKSPDSMTRYINVNRVLLLIFLGMSYGSYILIIRPLIKFRATPRGLDSFDEIIDNP